MKTKQKLFAVFFLMLLSALALSGCGSTKQESNKEFHVGTNATYVPFEFKNENDRYTGFDMELAEALAQEMGLTLQVHNIAFDGLIPAIMTGEIDAIMSGMVITPERQKKLDYIPYFKTGLGILTTTDATDIQGKSDLRGKKVAVQMGTTGAVEAHTIPDAEIREFDHNSQALLELEKGSVDAAIVAIPVAQHYLASGHGKPLHLVEQPLNRQTLGIAVSKDQTAKQEKVKAALYRLKENGTYDALYKKWFGQEPPVAWN